MLEEETKTKDVKKTQDEEKMVVLRVDMHCEACKNKVRKALKRFPGVEKIDIDMKERKVTVKGKIDPREVYEAVKKKSGRRTELIFPEIKKEDLLIDSINSIVNSITELLNPKPPDTTVELNVKMHCGGCAKQIKRSLMKMEGVMEVNEDLYNDRVTVKGRGLDAHEVCERVRQSGKYCEVIPPPPKKEERGNEKKPKEEKKEEKKAVEEKKEDKKEEEKKEGEDKKDEEIVRKEEKEVKTYVYSSYQSVPEYIYPPHQGVDYNYFSDENANSCSIM